MTFYSCDERYDIFVRLNPDVAGLCDGTREFIKEYLVGWYDHLLRRGDEKKWSTVMMSHLVERSYCKLFTDQINMKLKDIHCEELFAIIEMFERRDVIPINLLEYIEKEVARYSIHDNSGEVVRDINNVMNGTPVMKIRDEDIDNRIAQLKPQIFRIRFMYKRNQNIVYMNNIIELSHRLKSAL